MCMLARCPIWLCCCCCCCLNRNSVVRSSPSTTFVNRFNVKTVALGQTRIRTGNNFSYAAADIPDTCGHVFGVCVLRFVRVLLVRRALCVCTYGTAASCKRWSMHARAYIDFGLTFWLSHYTILRIARVHIIKCMHIIYGSERMMTCCMSDELFLFAQNSCAPKCSAAMPRHAMQQQQQQQHDEPDELSGGVRLPN